jgi:hypothetical protein
MLLSGGQFVSILEKLCFSRIHRPWLVAFRQSGYALLTPRHQPGNPCNTISKNSGLVGNYSCRQWGIIIVVDGAACVHKELENAVSLSAHIKPARQPRDHRLETGAYAALCNVRRKGGLNFFALASSVW